MLAEEVGLRLLVDIEADARRIPIAYDASRLAKQVRIRSGEGISLEELWTTTNRLLADEGLACIRIAGQDGLSIVSLEQAPGLARVETGDIEESEAGFVKVLRPLPRTGPQPTSIVDATKKVFGQDGSSTVELVGSDFLLLAGLKPQVLEAERVLDSLEAAATATESSGCSKVKSARPRAVCQRPHDAATSVKTAAPSLSQTRAGVSE